MTNKSKEIVSESVDVIEAPVVSVISPAPTKVYTLEQWAQMRKKPERHMAGIRAFLKTDAKKKFSLSDWDAKLKSY